MSNLSNLDIRELRNAFGAFMTGVTVVTTREKNGTPRGFTANSFCSVSLEPPLLSICIGKSADSIDVFTNTDGFAINILAEQQTEVSNLFASKRSDKFEVADWRDGPEGHPVLDGVCAWFDCTMSQQVDAGDHILLIGKVSAFDYSGLGGLGYVRGGYITPGLQQAAVAAATNAASVIVGAIVDFECKLLLLPDGEDGLKPVASGRSNERGSTARLTERLDALDIGASISSLYAVFENEATGQQSIYYRAVAEHAGDGSHFYAPSNIPWEQIGNSAIESMLRRYIEESHEQRYGVYFGNENTGRVQPVLCPG